MRHFVRAIKTRDQLGNIKRERESKSEENGRGWREKRSEKKSELFSIRDSGGVAFETL